MALINCPECNREVSDKAAACIHCGYPTSPTSIKEEPVLTRVAEQEIIQSSEPQPTIEKWGPFPMKPSDVHFIIMAIISIGGLILGILNIYDGASIGMAFLVWLMVSLFAVVIFMMVLEFRKRKLDPEYARQVQERTTAPTSTYTADADAIEAKRQRLAYKAEKQAYKDAKRQARCPRCGSTSLSAHKKGFGIGKAVVGATLTGGIGLVAGNIGAKKVRVTCLKCGKQFWA